MATFESGHHYETKPIKRDTGGRIGTMYYFDEDEPKKVLRDFEGDFPSSIWLVFDGSTVMHDVGFPIERFVADDKHGGADRITRLAVFSEVASEVEIGAVYEDLHPEFTNA